MHLLDLPKLKKQFEAMEGEEAGGERYEAEKNRILKEEAFTHDYLR